MAVANAEAARLLSRIDLPPGAHRVGHLSGPQFAGGFDVPTCNPQTDAVRLWTVNAKETEVITYMKDRPAVGSKGEEVSGSAPSNVPPAEVIMENAGQPGPPQEILDITISEVGPDQVGIRADAYVAPRSSSCTHS